MDWDDLVSWVKAQTTACLSAEERVLLLDETYDDAKRKHEECGRSFGRIPGEAAATHGRRFDQHN